MGRTVDTVYGPLPGCPDCGVISLSGEPHVCEHGVTPALHSSIDVTVHISDEDYDKLIGED